MHEEHVTRPSTLQGSPGAEPPPVIEAVSEEEYYDQLAQGNDEVVVASRFSWRDLYRTEDWWVIWLGFLVIAAVVFLKVMADYDLTALKFTTWTTVSQGLAAVLNGEFLLKFLVTYGMLAGIFTLGMAFLKKEKIRGFVIAFTGLYLLAGLAYLFASQISMKQYLEYAFWALGLGLVISHTVGVPAWLRPAIHSEYYVKTGLVIMGTEVLFSNLTKFGFYGIAIAWIVVPVVILFMWWLGTQKLKMSSKPMVMVIAVATAVCGVSAAIAAAAASRAKKNDLTFAVGLSMMFTILMMVGMPPLVRLIGLGELAGGAWIGNTVDSTGAVVLAGEALGPVGAQAAALVKMIQNVLIGFIAFAIAVFFATWVDETGQAAVGPGEIWDRLPKFILGFLAASLLFSFVVLPGVGMETTTRIISSLGSFKGWAFCLAFLCIGLETNFREMAGQMEGGKPMTLYLVGQTFSLILSLALCWLLLSGVVIPAPDLTVFQP